MGVELETGAMGWLVKGSGVVRLGQRQGPRGSHSGQSEQQATYRVQVLDLRIARKKTLHTDEIN